MPTLPGKKPMIHLGADPGEQGGICLILPRGIIYTTMPESESDLWGWLAPAVDRGTLCAVVERVWAFGREGAVGAFTFGKNYGMLRMAAAACGCQPDTPTPQEWQKALGIEAVPKPKRPKKFRSKEEEKQFKKLHRESKNGHKEALRARAEALYPHLELWDETLKRQRAICDAILLAHYCKLKHTGKLDAARPRVRKRNASSA